MEDLTPVLTEILSAHASAKAAHPDPRTLSERRSTVESVQGGSGPRSAPNLYVDLCLSVADRGARGAPASEAVRDAEDALLWLARTIATDHDPDFVDVVHVAALACMGRKALPLAKRLLFTEWMVRKSGGHPPAAMISVYHPLAVAVDASGSRSRARRLLARACAVTREAEVDPFDGDMSLRLYAACEAEAGHLALATVHLMEAERFCGDAYEATPLQVTVAWINAICGQAFSFASRWSLLDIAVYALGEIGAKKDPRGEFSNLASMPAGLERTRLGHLGLLANLAARRILKECRPDDVDGESEAILLNNLGNCALRVDWTGQARLFFEENIALITSLGSGGLDDMILYQLMHAHAGIGYSYYNEARSSQPVDAHLHRMAIEAFELAAVAASRMTVHAWSEGRIWAHLGTSYGAIGDEGSMHRWFARALTVGTESTVYEFGSQDLTNFFNVDFKVRELYSQALQSVGCRHAAVLWLKAAVYTLHWHASPMGIDEASNEFLLAHAHVHRALAERLIDLGRHLEAEHVISLIHDTKFSVFLQRSSYDADLMAHLGLTSYERRALSSASLESMVSGRRGAGAGLKADDEVLEAFSRFGAEIEALARTAHRSEPREEPFQREIDRTAREPSTAFVRYFCGPDRVSITVCSRGSIHHRQSEMDFARVSTLCFKFRDACRRPHNHSFRSFVETSNLLFDVLIAPIAD